MNCKPGDLAVIVRAGPEATKNIGLLVNVVKQFPGISPAGWVVKETLTNNRGLKLTHCEDCCLRPIRGNDGEDETLTWAGKPAGVTA